MMPSLKEILIYFYVKNKNSEHKFVAVGMVRNFLSPIFQEPLLCYYELVDLFLRNSHILMWRNLELLF